MYNSVTIAEKIINIEKELRDLRKDLLKYSEKKSVEEKLNEYHAFLEKILKSKKVIETPDEIIQNLHRKEY